MKLVRCNKSGLFNACNNCEHSKQHTCYEFRFNNQKIATKCTSWGDCYSCYNIKVRCCDVKKNLVCWDKTKGV